MNVIAESQVKEVSPIEEVVAQDQPNAIVEIDLRALGLVGGGLVSPCFA